MSDDKNLDGLQETHAEDAGEPQKGDVINTIRQPHSEIYAEALLRFPTDEHIDKGEEAKLRRKLDRKLLPLLGICYFFYVSQLCLLISTKFSSLLTRPSVVRRQDYSLLRSHFWNQEGLGPQCSRLLMAVLCVLLRVAVLGHTIELDHAALPAWLVPFVQYFHVGSTPDGTGRSA